MVKCKLECRHVKRCHWRESIISKEFQIVRYAEAGIPVALGDHKFQLVVYREDPTDKDNPREHMAIVAGALTGTEPVLCRVHSECWTGETLGSLKCDCREQLDLALAAIGAAGRGVIIYLRQEGRGIGLGNKIRAYALQEKGADTVEANEQLGFGADLRGYEIAAQMLRDLGVKTVKLMTNNPDKVAGLERAGVHVAERVAHWGTQTAFNEDYLEVKKSKLGHKA